MGKVGRFACIFVPMALSIASLLCLLLVFLGGQNKGNDFLTSLYFMKTDASEFNSNPQFDIPDVDVPGTEFDDKLREMFQMSVESDNLKDFYTIHIWNYCEGDMKDGKETTTFCSPRETGFYFDPIKVWKLDGTLVQEHFPEELNKGLEAYQKVARWMFAVYAIAFFTTLAEIVIGIFAICSRWGSLVTTIVSTASSLFTIAAAITSTALFGVLAGTFNTVLKPYNISASISTRMLSVVWLAVAFSAASGFFWLISTCCCSGKSNDKKRGRPSAVKTPYTYERVASPYMGHAAGHDVPLQNVGPAQKKSKLSAAFEPFRRDNRV